MESPDEYVLDFPTLGFLAADWIEAHCTVPGGDFFGLPFVHDGWQLWCTVNHYRVKTGLKFAIGQRLGAPAFFYRRSIVIGPQKVGKSPWGGSLMLFEAVGPSMVIGVAKGGEVYRCADEECPCGFQYAYERGEPMGAIRPKSLIQLMAVAETQVENVYGAMQTMVRGGPLEERVKIREGFMRLPNGGKIEVVTSGVLSKVGAPVTAALADETGLYTVRNKLLKAWSTIQRGLAGMKGRAIEMSNAWDPAEASAAQQGFESRRPDIFRFYRRPPANLRYTNARDRAKIHRFVYQDAPWVDLPTIEASAAEIIERDVHEAARFYGNICEQGQGAYYEAALWESTVAESPSKSKEIAVGFDGSRSGDWTAIRAETIDGYRFTPTYGPDKRPTFWRPDEWGGRIPRSEVTAAMSEIFANFNVSRAYIDPRHWETQADEWAKEFGDDVVVMWPTNIISRMFEALTRFIEDSIERLTTHDDDPTVKLHMLAARKKAQRGDKYTLEKPSDNQKIDLAMADILAHEAASDARALGWEAGSRNQIIVFR